MPSGGIEHPFNFGYRGKNPISDLNLTDVWTCYKAFRTSLLRSIPIRSNRFGIEPEVTLKLARREVRIYETPISYHGRTYEEGKKVGLFDAFAALPQDRLPLSYSCIADRRAKRPSLKAIRCSRRGRPDLRGWGRT